MTLIAIYRHQLFKRSESFIHAQASNVPRHTMFYVGRQLLGDPPSEVEYSVLSQSVGKFAPGSLRHALLRHPKWFADSMKNRGVSIIHAHFGVEGVYAERIAARLNLPLVTTFHGYDASMSSRALLMSGTPSWINYVLYRRRLAERGRLFICVSEFVRNKVLQLGFPADRCLVHYIGVDTAGIRYSSARSIEPTVLHVARLVEKKGTTDLIAAFAAVLKTVPEAKLVIVGDGPLAPTLKAQVQSLGIECSVEFLGAQPNTAVLELMARAWVLCVPSVTAKSGDSEGLPIVVLEAAASGLPVIATRHGGLIEGIAHEKTGLLHDEHDVPALVENLALLLKDANIRLNMGQSARRNAVERFDLHTQSKALAGIYDSIG